MLLRVVGGRSVEVKRKVMDGDGLRRPPAKPARTSLSTLAGTSTLDTCVLIIAMTFKGVWGTYRASQSTDSKAWQIRACDTELGGMGHVPSRRI